MVKKYLITYFKKIELKKKAHIIFENEYLKKLYTDYQLRNYKCSSIESLNQVYKKKINYYFCLKKAQRYLSEIFPILNALNNSKLKKKEWEILMEYFLIISIMNIKTRFDTLKKIKDRKNIYVYADNYNCFIENTDIYKKFHLEDFNFNSYINYLISKRLNFRVLKSKKIRKVFLLVLTRSLFKACLNRGAFFGSIVSRQLRNYSRIDCCHYSHSIVIVRTLTT